MKFIFKNIFFLSLLLSTLLFVSCGKESSSSSDSSSETPSGPHSGRTENQNIPIGGKEGALSTLLESESVNCSDPHSCNESVGKIIISIENGQQTCSGVLVSRNKVLTSASCLTKELRKSGIDCKEDIGVIFPETISRPEYKIKCQTILIADDVDDERDPASYKSDLALLELEGDVPRKFANISSGTFLEEESYISWQVVQDVKGQDYLTTQSCLALSRNVALPAFTEKSSALWSVGNCFHDERALGSPIFDAQGNVIGINSKLYRPSDRIKNVFNSISREGRSGPVSFAIPLACHALVTEEIRKSEGLECVVNANFQNFEIDALRLQILEDESLHEENKNMVLESLKVAFKYTKMTFDFFKSKEK